MAARIALALSALLLCLAVGWVSAPAPPPVVAVAHPLRLAALRLAPAGEAAAADAAFLAGGAPPAAVAPATAAPLRSAATLRPLPPPPPPPLPQADAVLRASVAAVTQEGGRLRLVLAGGGRRLGEGERFMGWTLASVSRSGAVLRKGGAVREVSFFAPGSPSTTTVAPDALGPPASGGSLAPIRLPGPHAPVRPPPAPSEAEFFRGFKG